MMWFNSTDGAQHFAHAVVARSDKLRGINVSVCLSVCHIRWCIVYRRLKISSN